MAVGMAGPTMPTIDELRAQLESNILGDRFLSGPSKTLLIEELKVDAAALEQAWERVRREQFAVSTELPAALAPEPGGYGHLIRESPFFRHLSGRTGVDIDRLEKVFDAIFGLSPDSSPEEADDEWGLLVEGEPLRASREIWIFRGALENPFDEPDLSRIPCRLGLQLSPGLRLLPFRISSADLRTVRPPCAYDVDFGYSWFWRPDGMTFPVCVPVQAGEPGFREFIASPPNLRDSVPVARAIVSA